MHRGMNSGQRINPYWIIGLLLVIIALMVLNRGGFPWPLIFIFFSFGSRVWGRHSHDEKRKYGAPDVADEAKPKHDEAGLGSRYLLTDDGEVIELVDAPGVEQVKSDER